jgi:Cft2 family RNA processing exonuclease
MCTTSKRCNLLRRAGGLTKGFRQGTIYCTPATAALVRLKIKVAESALRAVPLGQEVVVEGARAASRGRLGQPGLAPAMRGGEALCLNTYPDSCSGPLVSFPHPAHNPLPEEAFSLLSCSPSCHAVRECSNPTNYSAGTRIKFLDANHCPGSALIAAFPPDGAPPVLHTGDARLTREATRGCPVLEGMRGRAVLVLDTTYADPQYCFPPQQQVVDSVIRSVKVRGENWGRPDVLRRSGMSEGGRCRAV